jgi:erythronate-4-phosphate dehydrogenase
VKAAFGAMGDITRYPGREIGPDAVKTADVLLVRSVTSVDEALLDDSSVQFVGSATIGTDHVDRDYLDAAGIAFAHAPASNADSVADYVVAALLRLAQRRGVSLEGRTVGIVGCGNIGSRLARRLPALGLTVLKNDPPRAESTDVPHDFVSLDRVLDRADIVTCHVPITTEGAHPTRHLLDAGALAHLSEEAWLINTSRGAVVDNDALLTALRADQLGAAVLDVWEGEPTPTAALVDAVDLATPHIAGYAYDGKVRGTTMLYEALCEYLDVEQTWSADAVLAPDSPDALRCRAPDPRLPRTDWLDHLARQAYDLQADDGRMRAYLEQPAGERGDYFRHLRATYPTRREMQIQTVPGTGVPPAYRRAVTDGLTLQCI